MPEYSEMLRDINDKKFNFSPLQKQLNESAFSGNQINETKCIMGELARKIKNGTGYIINWLASSYKNATAIDMRGRKV